MLQVYLVALAFGGTLLIASLVLGSKDKDLDKDLEKDFEKDLGGGGVLFWLPIASLRFWTFLLAFGGAAGTLLTYLSNLPMPVVAAIAGGLGWVAGVAMVGVMSTIRKNSVGSEVSRKDLHGETAQVTVALAKDGVGKIRLSAKGRVLDLIAETDDAEPLPIGASVTILGDGEHGRVQVTKVLA